MVWVVAVLAAAVLAAACLYANRSFDHDDAYISLRYARKLVTGEGLVWNPGERVEVYSNFLFTLLVATLGALRVDLIAASRAIDGLALIALSAFLLSTVRSRAHADSAGRPSIPIALLCVGASFSLLVWTLGGLEGPLFAALSCGGICLIARSLERGPLRGGGAPRPAREWRQGVTDAMVACRTWRKPDGCADVILTQVVPIGFAGELSKGCGEP